MSSQTLNTRKSKSAATLAAVLAFGAGGGAVSTYFLNNDDGSKSTNVTTPTAATQPIAATTSTSNASAVYSKVKQGVVDIKVTTSGGSSSSGSQGQQQQDSPFGLPGGSDQGQGQGESGGSTATAEGSGFVVDKQGHIVTNQHVVDGASSVEVTFADGSKASAKVVGTDPSNDLAVIKVDGVDSSKLQPLTLADSSSVKVGDAVYALGSPYGLEDSFTAGIVSALGRTIQSPNQHSISGAIQTDAAINHGNSGGPLLNTSGQVVGVNAQIQSDSGDNSGVGFAIQSNQVRSIAGDIISGGTVQHPYLGVELGDGPDGGAQVGTVKSGSPADSAGLQEGDVITAVDGQSVSGSDDVVGAVQSHKVGDKLQLTVQRDGQEKSITVTLGNDGAQTS
jgi:putative serine protease PepD